MYEGWNGIDGIELTGSEQQYDTTSMDSYDVIDVNYSTISNMVGYQDGYFGNDPLSQSKHYQCPDFPGMTYVDSYVRSDGTLVNGHWRTNPDGIISNNFSANK